MGFRNIVNPPSFLERSVTSVSESEEAQQSFKIKKNALLHALSAKKNVSNQISLYLHYYQSLFGIPFSAGIFDNSSSLII
jgi:hypothetical protein